MNEAVIATDSDELLGTEEDLNSEIEATDASTVETESNEESQDESVVETQEEKSEKKPTGIQKRFQKYDHKLQAQAAELEYWKKVALENKAAPEPQEQVVKPKLADYETVEEYVEAREQFLKKELFSELERTATQKATQATVQQGYMQKVEAAKRDLADWDDVMEEAADEPTSPETINFCMDSPIGPKIAYHLAKNPELHDKINSMSPIRRIAELGKLEDKLQTKVVVKPETKAPAKLTEVGSGSTPVRLSTDAPRNYTEWKKAHEQRQKATKR